MNKIFKVKKNLLEQAVVVSELAKNRDKVASALLFSLLTVSMAHATPVAIQGVVTSKNAVAIGTNSFATAVDGVAGGQGAIATGQGFNREDFAAKVKEVEDLTNAKNAAESELNNLNNDKATNDNTQKALNDQIADATQKMADAADKINQKNDLTNQKNAAENNKPALDQKVSDAQTALDNILKEGKNLYLLFTPILQTLDYNQLNETDGRSKLSLELKTLIENDFPEFAGKYEAEKYGQLIDGYVNKQAGYEGSVLGIATQLKNLTIQNRQNLGQQHFFNDGDFGNNFSNTLKLLEQNQLQDKEYFGLTDSSKLTGVAYISGITYPHNRYLNLDEDFLSVYRGDFFANDENSKKSVNTSMLGAISKAKLIKDGVGDYLLAMSVPVDNKPKQFGDDIAIFKLKTTTGKFIPVTITNLTNIYGKHLESIANSNTETLTLQAISDYEIQHNALMNYYNSVDWNDSNAAYDLNLHKQAVENVIKVSNKIVEYNNLYKEILNLRSQSNAEQDVIDQKTAQLLNFYKEIKTLNENPLNHLENHKLVLTNKAEEYFNYGKTETNNLLDRIATELALYDKDDAIVVDVTNKAKELQDALDNAKKEAEDNQAVIDDLTKQIDDIGLTPEEEAAEQTKKDLEDKLQDAKDKQAQIDSDIADKTQKLDELKDKLTNSPLKDLGLRSQAHGSNAFASGNDSIAMGTSATVTSNDGIAIGRDSNVTGTQSIAIGADNKITGEKSIALGVGNTIGSNNVVAIGNDIAVEVGFDKAVVLGAESTSETANPTSSITIKGNQYNFVGTNPDSTVSVGAEGKERQIVNVAAGRISATSTDAINGSQLHAVAEAVERLETTTNINWDEINNRIQAVKVPKTSIIAGDNVNLSERTTDTGDIEYTVNVRLPDPQPTTPTTVQAPTKPATVVKAGDDSGNIKIVKEEGSVAEQRPDVYSVSINPELKLNKINVNGNTGKISGLTDGEVREGSTEAITGNQLHQTNLKVNHLTTNVNGLTDKVNQGLTFSTENNGELNKQLGERITIVGDGRNIETSVSDRGDIQVALKDEIEVKKVKVGKTEITEKGINAGGNKIENVADGEVNPNSTDAVTGRQLYQAMTNIAVGSNQVAQNLGNQINKINNRVDNLEQRMTKEDKNLRAGVAGVAAIAGLPQVRGNGKSMVSAAAGNYRGQSAVAVGYTRASDNGKVLLKLSGSANTQGDVVSSVGIGYEW